MRIKKHDELRPKRLSTVSFITPLFPTLANTLKTKVGDVVGYIFEVECSVGGFSILKQIQFDFVHLSINCLLDNTYQIFF
jgi:hypothetical protein